MTTTINASTSSGLVNTADTSGILQLQTASTAALTIDASQNVGIGTASPTQKLTVSGSSSLGTASASGNTAIFQAPGSLFLTLNTNGTLSGNRRNWAISPEADVAGALSIACGASEGASPTSPKMIITSGGNVSIGTTSNIARIGVVFDGSTDNGCVLRTSTNASGTGFLYFQQDTTSCGSVVRVGTTSAVTYSSTSDYRLKENITPMMGALNKVARLKPVTYTWKSGGESAEGFIAHELAEVCPDAVVGTKDELDKDGNPKYQSIDTSFLVATLTAAIQELKAINDTQAETINALTARIVALENR